MSTRESGPRGAAPESAKTDSSLPLTADELHEFATAYVVVACTPTGRYSRRVYLSLHSATKAVARAHDRGQPAELVLCRLVPAGGGLR